MNVDLLRREECQPLTTAQINEIKSQFHPSNTVNVVLTLPTGSIITTMGNNAPDGYLACDGTVYNIKDYQDLADYFIEQFESANYFGGNGETTFAVPDLRGEFLRGSGTNSHTNQGSGANVGVHQDGTKHVSISTSSDTVFGYSGSGEMTEQNKDSVIGKRSGQYISTRGTSNNYATYYTSRPTNTSVLYSIKY